MNCPYCNKENLEEAKFCNNCGKPLEDGAAEKVVEVTADKKEKKGKSKSKKKKIIIAVLIAFLLIGVIGSSGCEHVLTEADCINAPVCKECGKEVGVPLGHDWKEATCTEIKTCERCKITEGEALGHDWQEATCEEPKTCKRCDETEGEALGHQSANWDILLEATCTEEGEKTGTCTVCSKEITVAIEKKNHKVGDWVVTEKATVSEKGKKQKKCSVCGEVVEEKEYSLSKKKYKESCKSYSYKKIARSPKKYKGKLGKFSGKVIQVMESTLFDYTSYTLRVAVNGDYDSVLLVTYYASPDEDHILEDDYVTLYGEIQGTKSYETVMGNEITIPYVDAEIIDIK